MKALRHFLGRRTARSRTMAASRTIALRRASAFVLWTTSAAGRRQLPHWRFSLLFTPATRRRSLCSTKSTPRSTTRTSARYALWSLCELKFMKIKKFVFIQWEVERGKDVALVWLLHFFQNVTIRYWKVNLLHIHVFWFRWLVTLVSDPRATSKSLSSRSRRKCTTSRTRWSASIREARFRA